MTPPDPLPAQTGRPCQPAPTYLATLDGYMADAIEDVRRHASELESNDASEFSIGRGRVVPWVARQARQERRYPQVDDGYNTPYRGTSPPCAGPVTLVSHNASRFPRTGARSAKVRMMYWPERWRRQR